MRYWFVGENLSESSWLSFLNPGTDVVKIFTFPLVKYFHLPFFIGFFIFSIISAFGVYQLWKILENLADGNKSLVLISALLMLLPNLHFWTSLIGKEALIFPLLIFFLNDIQRKKYFSLKLFLSIIFIAVIRPHVAFVLVLSYVLSLLLTEKMTKNTKLFLISGFLVSTGIFTFLLTQLHQFTKSFERIIQLYKAHIRVFKKTDGYVPLDEYALPYKIFTFYFRPLPLEKEGLFYHVISIENFLLLMIFGVTTYFSIKYFRSLKKRMLFVFPIVFLLFFALMYVYAYANYGIIMRTKIMAIPFLYVLFLTVGQLAFIKNKEKN